MTGLKKCEISNVCHGCKKPLSADEIAMTKKLVNRGAKTYYCIDCMAKMFGVERKDIEEKIIYYKRMGCTLFCAKEQ